MSSLKTSQVPLFILAGGRATRLSHLAESRPKYLMPITEEKVFADAHLEWVKKQGFKQVILSVGYLADQIKDYCGQGEKWDLAISYMEDGATPLGTGGAVQKSLSAAYTHLAITYGDTLLDLNVNDMLAQLDAPGIMSIYQNEVPGHICNIDFKDRFVTYDKSAPQKEWKYIDYGFMVLSRMLIETFPSQTPFDLSVPLKPMSLDKQILGYPVKNRFWEIGSPESLAEFQKRFQISN